MARNLREADDDGGEEEFDYGEEPNFEVRICNLLRKDWLCFNLYDILIL